MRTYASLAPTFWTRGSGKRIRGDAEAQIVALYLMSSPATNMVGIFNMDLPTLCHQTGLTLEGARKGLARCSEEQIAFWDEEEELVWVPALARYQIGESLRLGKGGKPDHRVRGVERALAPFKGHRFYDLFIERYGLAYLLNPEESEGAPKGLQSPYVPDPDLVPVPDPDPKSETGATEPTTETKPKPRDPLLDSLIGRSPKSRLDVLALFERHKKLFGQPEAKLDVGAWSSDADCLAEAIDAYGSEACNLVCDEAPNDGMVSGRDDERRQKHTSIRYIFGNQTAFMRILGAARRNKKPGSSVAEQLAALKERQA